jgi:predicted nucleic acid-binding Zn ribbon protein
MQKKEEDVADRGPRAPGARRERGPEPIGTILERWLRATQVRKRIDPREVFDRWPQIVGPEVAGHTRVVDCKRGVLTVEVDSSGLLHDLSTYRAEDLLESIREQEEFQDIREIRFRAGSF